MSFWLMALKLKGMLGLFSGVSRCCEDGQMGSFVLCEGCNGRGERTTWRASLVKRGVVDKARHWALREGYDAWDRHRDSLGTILEAIVKIGRWEAGL